MTALQLTLPSVMAGVAVECRRFGQRLRVVVIEPGYWPWFVTFPRALRIEGARFVVESLRPTARSYYRAAGQIARLVDDGAPKEDRCRQ